MRVLSLSTIMKMPCRSFFKYLAMENIIKIVVESSRLKAEPGAEGL